MASLGDHDPAARGEPSRRAPGALHQRAPALRIDVPGRLRRTDRRARCAPLQQREDRRLQRAIGVARLLASARLRAVADLGPAAGPLPAPGERATTARADLFLVGGRMRVFRHRRRPPYIQFNLRLSGAPWKPTVRIRGRHALRPMQVRGGIPPLVSTSGSGSDGHPAARRVPLLVVAEDPMRSLRSMRSRASHRKCPLIDRTGAVHPDHANPRRAPGRRSSSVRRWCGSPFGATAATT